MAFDVVACGSRRTMNSADTVAMAVYNTAGVPTTLSIRIGANVLTALGWQIGGYVQMLEGSGNDLGIMKLVSTTRGGSKLSTAGGNSCDAVTTSSLRYLRHLTPPATMQPQEEVSFQVFGGEMTLITPSFLAPGGECRATLGRIAQGGVSIPVQARPPAPTVRPALIAPRGLSGLPTCHPTTHHPSNAHNKDTDHAFN